jgi:hypothetical protein
MRKPTFTLIELMMVTSTVAVTGGGLDGRVVALSYLVAAMFLVHKPNVQRELNGSMSYQRMTSAISVNAGSKVVAQTARRMILSSQ